MNTTSPTSRLGCWAAALMFISPSCLLAQDPLDSWTIRPVPDLTANLNGIAFGNGTFVAVGDASTVARSADGIQWTVSSAGAYGNLLRIRFLNGQFVAVGSSDKILFSTDGSAWTANTLPAAGFWDVAAGNGVYVVAGPGTFVSSNALDWIPTHPMLSLPYGFPPYETRLDSIVFGDNYFVALPTGGVSPTTFTERHSVRSTNGLDWIEGSTSPVTVTGGTGDILSQGGLVLGAGVGNTGGPGLKGVWASTNSGATWCCGFGGPSLQESSTVAYGQGYYIYMVRYFGRPFIYASTNASSWTLRYPGNEQSGPHGGAFGNGTFVVVGLQGYILQSGNLSGAPLISVQPLDRGAIADNPASFSVQVSGAPPLAFQWFRTNGTAIVNATNASYTIQHVMPSDAGGYWAVISNSFGSVTSRVAQLSVSFLNIKNYAGIEILGVAGRTYRIEATATTGTANWQTLTNLVLPASPYVWIDYGSPAAGQRLYRAAELP